jgi:tetratricopeptide (TPR) repeat protein
MFFLENGSKQSPIAGRQSRYPLSGWPVFVGRKILPPCTQGRSKAPPIAVCVGNGLRRVGGTKKAPRFYGRALDADPSYIDARLNYGACLQGIGQFAEAEAAFRRVTDEEPGFLLAHYNLGTTLADQARYDEAIIAFECTLENLDAQDPGRAKFSTRLQTLQMMIPDLLLSSVCHAPGQPL